ncbi:MAG: hypothetical protein ACRDQ5_04425 [Sciscionella sp.]
MAGGFTVDLGALRKAAEGVTDALDAMATKKVSDIDARKDDFGNDRLGSTVSDFCDRWELGVEHLSKDVQHVAGQLTESVNAYLHVERVTKGQLDGILRRSSGDDPAAQ